VAATKTFIALLLSVLLAPLAARAGCDVQDKASIPLSTIDGTMTVPLEVNGIAATFILDTGAQRSLVTEEAVRRLGLSRDAWVGTTMSGIGGIDRRPNAIPRSLSLGGIPLVRRTLHHDTSMTVGIMPSRRTGAVTIDGLLGRDFLSLFDLDLDVPGGRLTLYQVQNCDGRFLPWPGGYSAIPVAMPAESALVVPVTLDATPLHAMLDSGASASLLAAPGMFRAGVALAGLAADPATDVSGLGPHVVIMRRHKFHSLRVGGEVIDAPLIWVAPIRLTPIVDMLLGADWLAVRHVWISYATRQLFVADPAVRQRSLAH
jgi:hypothetical protein